MRPRLADAAPRAGAPQGLLPEEGVEEPPLRRGSHGSSGSGPAMEGDTHSVVSIRESVGKREGGGEGGGRPRGVRFAAMLCTSRLQYESAQSRRRSSLAVTAHRDPGALLAPCMHVVPAY